METNQKLLPILDVPVELARERCTCTWTCTVFGHYMPSSVDSVLLNVFVDASKSVKIKQGIKGQATVEVN